MKKIILGLMLVATTATGVMASTGHFNGREHKSDRGRLCNYTSETGHNFWFRMKGDTPCSPTFEL